MVKVLTWILRDMGSIPTWGTIFSTKWMFRENKFNYSLMTLFLLMRFAFMVASNDLWYRLINNPHLDCPSLQSLWWVPEPCQWLGSCSLHRGDLCLCLVVTPLHRSLTWMLGMNVVKVVGIQMGVHLPVPLTPGRREAMWDSFPTVLQSSTSSLAPSCVFMW